MVYVDAPEVTIRKVLPLQMLPLVAATTGNATTVTVATAVFEERQPTELVPVTEYEVFDAGLTVKLFPVTV
jgi:hypothetical protein